MTDVTGQKMTRAETARPTDTGPRDITGADMFPPDLEGNRHVAERHAANMLTLEIVFLGFVAVVVIVAFIQALGYAIVSARTPFVIMVPLFLLILLQAGRLWGLRDRADFRGRLADVAGGRTTNFNKVLGFSGWMLALLGAVMVLGHYIGIFGFCMALMRGVAREKLKLALIVSVATTAAIFVIFEIGFNVELYRGLLLRYFMGYRDF